jgi:hypothetical protein
MFCAGTAEGGCLHIAFCSKSESKSLAGRGKRVIFTIDQENPTGFYLDFCQSRVRNSASGVEFARAHFPTCTKSGHALVDKLHSIEKTGSYKA